MSSIDFSSWTNATGNLDWGIQRVLKETLGLVAEGKSHLAHGTNVGVIDGRTVPCLINAVAQMIQADGNVQPASWFPEVVGAFDSINRSLVTAGVNVVHNIVSPLAAEVLIANFGPLKPVPTEDDFLKAAAAEVKQYATTQVYVEPSDAEFADYLAQMNDLPPATEDEWHAASERAF
jgi:hypothetical protein